MLPALICHIPSGASFNQLHHYAQQIQFGFFGKYMNNNQISSDFDVSRITIPMSLHYTTTDNLASPIDIEKLIPRLNNSQLYIQKISKPRLNHMDIIWGENAAALVYSRILKFFEHHK